MEHTTQSTEAYDFRQYDRIWQRVAPNLEPYPGMAAAQPMAPAQQTASVQAEASVRSEAPGLPISPAPAVPAVPVQPEGPAVPVPAIPGSQLPGAEQNPCCMGTEARKDLRDMAAGLLDQARRLMAAHYLITGQRYRPSISAERIYVGRWCPALRERYHAAACSGLNYARSAKDTIDPCLAKLFEEMSRESYAHAETLLGLLQRSLQST